MKYGRQATSAFTATAHASGLEKEPKFLLAGSAHDAPGVHRDEAAVAGTKMSHKQATSRLRGIAPTSGFIPIEELNWPSAVGGKSFDSQDSPVIDPKVPGFL